MKKLAYFGAAILALAACNKSQTVTAPEQPGEITVKAVVAPQTKGAEFNGTALPTDNSMLIYAAASTVENPNFFGLTTPFGGQEFSYCTDKWRASDSGSAGTPNPIYWPIGGAKVDFLAYTALAAKIGDSAGQIQPKFDGTKSAKEFKVDDWNVYNDQIDLMYAEANGKVNSTSAVSMEFKHTQALVIFNFRLLHGAGGIIIKNITFDSMVKSGDLLVNNEYNNPIVAWTLDAATDAVAMPTANAAGVSAANRVPSKTPTTVVKYNTSIAESSDFAQLGEPLLVIPQDAKNITIEYEISGKTFEYYLNVPRRTWQAGKAYVYNLSFNVYEIVLDPEVLDWDCVEYDA